MLDCANLSHMKPRPPATSLVQSLGLIAMASLIVLGCQSPAPTPTPTPTPTPPVPQSPDEAEVADAAAYWSSVIGLSVSIEPVNEVPRILFRHGTDGLGSAWGRGLVDGTDSGNWATSGLVVVRPGVPTRRVYRHEIGHALGFLNHSAEGLMAAGGGPDVLSVSERNMMVALYSLPAGSTVQVDGHWQAPDGTTGRLDDSRAARDIVELNSNASGGSAFRRLGVTCRWRDPVRIYVVR